LIVASGFLFNVATAFPRLRVTPFSRFAGAWAGICVGCEATAAKLRFSCWVCGWA
jgi:hypothetical protein